MWLLLTFIESKFARFEVLGLEADFVEGSWRSGRRGARRIRIWRMLWMGLIGRRGTTLGYPFKCVHPHLLTQTLLT